MTPRPARPNYDPDRRRPPMHHEQEHPDFWPMDPATFLDVCRYCSGVVPATAKARAKHLAALHEQVNRSTT